MPSEISCGFSYADRHTLIAEHGLSNAAREALELPGGELGDHFEATLTEQVAQDLLVKCKQRDLRSAAREREPQLKVPEQSRRAK